MIIAYNLSTSGNFIHNLFIKSTLLLSDLSQFVRYCPNNIIYSFFFSCSRESSLDCWICPVCLVPFSLSLAFMRLTFFDEHRQLFSVVFCIWGLKMVPYEKDSCYTFLVRILWMWYVLSSISHWGHMMCTCLSWLIFIVAPVRVSSISLLHIQCFSPCT